MATSPLFDRSVTVAGREYSTLTKDIADYPERLTDVETDAETLLDEQFLYLHLGQVSTKASDAAVVLAPAPRAGTVQKIKTVLNAALATGDATFTGKIGATGITGGVVTATQSGSAAGDVDSTTTSALNTVAENDLISVTVGGASTATATADVYVLIKY